MLNFTLNNRGAFVVEFLHQVFNRVTTPRWRATSSIFTLTFLFSVRDLSRSKEICTRISAKLELRVSIDPLHLTNIMIISHLMFEKILAKFQSGALKVKVLRCAQRLHWTKNSFQKFWTSWIMNYFEKLKYFQNNLILTQP